MLQRAAIQMSRSLFNPFGTPTSQLKLPDLIPASVLSIPESQMVNVDDRLYKCLRSLLRKVVTDSPSYCVVLVFPGEPSGIGAWVGVRRSVSVSFKGDGRNTDSGCLGKFTFISIIFRFALSQSLAPAIVVDDNFNVI